MILGWILVHSVTTVTLFKTRQLVFRLPFYQLCRIVWVTHLFCRVWHFFLCKIGIVVTGKLWSPCKPMLWAGHAWHGWCLTQSCQLGTAVFVIFTISSRDQILFPNIPSNIQDSVSHKHNSIFKWDGILCDFGSMKIALHLPFFSFSPVWIRISEYYFIQVIYHFM